MKKKLLITLGVHAVATLPSIFLLTNTNQFSTSTYDIGSTFLIVAAAGLYFLLMWKALYSKSYHYYLNRSISIVIRNMLFLTGSVFIIWGISRLYDRFFSASGHSSLAVSTSYLFILVASYWLFHAMQLLWISHLSKLGFFKKNTMVVGVHDERLPVSDIFQDINKTKEYRGRLLRRDGRWLFEGPHGNTFQEVDISLTDFLNSARVNEFIICLDPYVDSESLYQVVSYCIQNRIGYYLIPDIRKLPLMPPWNKPFAHIPFIERYCPLRDSLIMVSFKRLFDIVASATAVVFFLPIFILLSLLILAEDGLPVFYKSNRVGIHGKKIMFLKFRTMVKNAEALKKELMALNERPDGPLFKMRNDPRVTRIGRLLRRFSLDELPQFFNVLRGDMSLIGPRPHLPEEVAEYSGRDFLRLECIPGIACLPQIQGRDSIGFREWVELDLEYRRRWSPTYDLKIMAKTVQVALHPLTEFLSKKRA